MKFFKFTLVLVLLTPTLSIAYKNQKVDDCLKGQVPNGHENVHIILDRCDLTAEDMPVLVKALKGESIHSLEFWNNDTGSGGIGDKGIETLMELKNINYLSLGRNGITDDGIQYLANSGLGV